MPNWRAYVVPALFLALLCALGLSYFEGRKAGEYAVRLHSADSVLAVKAKVVIQTDTQYVPDSTAYHKLLRRYLALARGRPATQQPGDSAPVIPPVVGPLPTLPPTLADSVIQACSQTVTSCEARIAARDSLIAAQNTKIQLLLHKPGAPRFPSCVAGAGIGTSGKFELSVTCGVRLH